MEWVLWIVLVILVIVLGILLFRSRQTSTAKSVSLPHETSHLEEFLNEYSDSAL